jgi:hypothetical protein
MTTTGWIIGLQPLEDRPGWYDHPAVTNSARVWWDGQLWRSSPAGLPLMVQRFPWRGATTPQLERTES